MNVVIRNSIRKFIIKEKLIRKPYYVYSLYSVWLDLVDEHCLCSSCNGVIYINVI